MAKPKPRAYQVNMPLYAKQWSKKHRPFWCQSPDTCIRIAGKYAGTHVGWCTGIQPDRDDLDIITLCHTRNDPDDRSYVLTDEYNIKPDEAVDLAMDLLIPCTWAFYGNTNYEIDATRLRDRHRKKEARSIGDRREHND